jgi:hypothetical protein
MLKQDETTLNETSQLHLVKTLNYEPEFKKIVFVDDQQMEVDNDSQS